MDQLFKEVESKSNIIRFNDDLQNEDNNSHKFPQNETTSPHDKTNQKEENLYEGQQTVEDEDANGEGGDYFNNYTVEHDYLEETQNKED